MTAFLKAGDISPAALIDLIRGADIPNQESQPARIWAESPDAWTFDYWPGLDRELLWCASHRSPEKRHVMGSLSSAWAARIFSPSGELRWRVIDSLGANCCRVVFLGTQDWLPGQLGDRSDVLRTLCATHQRYLLWGQQSDVAPGEWIELRIPHRFRYPHPESAHRLRVLVELWRDAVGEIHFARLCDLESDREKNDAKKQ